MCVVFVFLSVFCECLAFCVYVWCAQRARFDREFLTAGPADDRKQRENVCL